MGKEYQLDENKIIQMYNEGMEINHIAKYYKVNFNVIKRRLVKNNIQLRTMSEVKKKENEKKRSLAKPPLLYNLEEDKIIRMYLEGKTIEEIIKIRGISLGTLKKRLEVNNIDTSNMDYFKDFEEHNLLEKRNGRLYTMDKDYFKLWTKSMAYIVGFLAADGAISSNGEIKLELQRQDREILERINDELYSSYEVVDITSLCNGLRYNTSRLTIRSI